MYIGVSWLRYKSTACFSAKMAISVPRTCLKPNWLSAVHRYLASRADHIGVLFCSVVLGTGTHLKLLGRAVSDARFVTGGVFEYDIAHRRSVAVLCMWYKIK